jgi:hypothetical protein
MIKYEQLSFIREKCIVANPEIGNDYSVAAIGGRLRNTSERVWNAKAVQGRPIRLADVLLAINATLRKERGTISLDENSVKLILFWNLRADDLEKQSEETISFLAELLK